MASTASLEDLIHNKEIEFYSSGRKFDTNLDNFGEHNWDLVKRIVKESGTYLVIKGNGLQEHLKTPQNLYSFTFFLIQSWFASYNKKQHFAIHVDVDIKKYNKHYKKPKKEELIDGTGQVVGNAASWVPEMPYFEKCWNFALDSAIGGMVGYPGHEHPREDESFRYIISQHAENYMIGTPQQIKRYKKYALESLSNVTRIAGELKKNPESIFDGYDKLHGLEMVTRHARIIAENITHFSFDYKTS